VKWPLLAVLLATVAFAFVAACGGDDDAGNGAPSATDTAGPTATSSAAFPVGTAVFTTDAGESVELEVEIADDSTERAQGLSSRESLSESSGMVFIYNEDHLGPFWMKDTYVPLSIAFVAADGTIIDIQDMEPLTEELHRPPDVYRNAIEANQGWFDRNGIAVGDTVSIPDA
jgi:uncharacterized membrane protein (UPF0127 family)